MMFGEVASAIMERLKPLSEVRIYVPSRDRHGRALPLQSLLRRVEGLILQMATGTTIFWAQGIWQSDNGNLVRESVLIVEGYLNASISPITRESVVAELIQLAVDAHQEALAIVIDRRLFLIPGAASRGQRGERRGEQVS